MRKKIIWFVVSCLMALSLVMASCGPAEEEAEVEVGEEEVEVGEEEVGVGEEEEVVTEEIEMISVTLTKLDGTTMVKSREEPRYGGTLTGLRTSPYQAHDPYKTRAISVGHMQLTSNELMQGNYVIGPHGTEDVDWLAGFAARYDVETGELAESWEVPDEETIIFHIRKGVHYHDKPPVNGRELIAEDVAWWMDAQYNVVGLWQNLAYPPQSGMAPTSFKALDKYTVEIKVPAEYLGLQLLEIGDNAYTNPPECWTEYGGWGDDWTKIIGTGPFILTDYVADSSATYKKNPNYFEYDPVLIEYRLPYIDTYKELIITDPSTQLAAFRTGKIDYIRGLGHDDAQLLLKQFPDMDYRKKVEACMASNIVAGRTDAPPFDDIRVRQAMNLAVNQQEILDEYFSGDADMYGWPFPDVKIFKPYYTQPEDLPEEVTILFDYDPERARQLLAEAGYPDGFQTKCLTPNSPAAIDYLSLIEGYLAEVNIDMAIEPLESGSFTGVQMGRHQEAGEMMNAMAIYAPDQPLAIKPGYPFNFGWVEDPYYEELFLVTGRDIISDTKNFQKVVKEACVHMLASSWGIWRPIAYTYNI